MILHISDVSQLENMPSDWVQRILQTVMIHAYQRQFDDNAPTAREKLSPGEVIKSWVVDGEQLSQTDEWLLEIYANEICALASKLTERQVEPGRERLSNVNINLMRGKGSRFEKHVDTNHLTGLLFVSTLSEHQGGALCLEVGDELIAIHPEVGKIVFVDARNIPHYVSPLQTEEDRIVIVMNFYFLDEEYDRPSYINDFIYNKPQNGE